MKLFSLIALFIFLPSVLPAQDEVIDVGGVAIVIPIPEGFTNTGKAPREIEIKGMGSITRLVECVRILAEPERVVQILNIQASQEQKDEALTSDEFVARVEPYQAANRLHFNNRDDLQFFSGDRRFGYMLFETTERSAQGQVSTHVLVKGKTFSMNYSTVTGKDNFDAVKNSEQEAKAFCDAILTAN